MKIVLGDYFGRVSRFDPPCDGVIANANELLFRVNNLLDKIQIAYPDTQDARDWRVNSGWRSVKYNATIPGAAVNSKHVTGQAIDLADPDGVLDNILFNDTTLLVEASLWLEHPASTKGWTHWQSVPPKSGNRVFFP